MRIKGAGPLVANMKRIQAKQITKAKRNMTLACIELMRLSVKEVPVDFGHLRSSIYHRVTGVGMKTKGIVGYAAVYAAFIHEHRRAGKTGGYSPKGVPYKHYARTGKWKYLEDPLKNNSKKLGAIIAGKFWI